MTETQDRLPQGWVWTTLREVTQINQRRSAIRQLPDELEVSFVPMAAVDADSGTIAAAEVRTLRSVRKGFTSFSNNDVIMAKITPSMENGKAAIARGLRNDVGFGSTEFHVLTPTNPVMPEYLFHFIRREDFRQDAKSNFAGTAGQLRVPTSFLEQSPFPLAPLPEQRRIVAKIEELFTRLDAGVAALKRVQAALKRYKASVLKAACEGRLVPQDPSDEPADVLLARILAERRAKWEAELRANGKDPKKAKYEEPEAPNVDGLPELPEGWVWATMAHIADVIGGVTKGRDFRGRPTIQRPYLRVFRARPFLEVFSSSWIVHFTNSEQGQQYFKEAAKQTTNLASINLTQLRKCPIAVPPQDEQTRIVEDIERRHSFAEALVSVLEATLARAARLRQSILAQAFSGQLVPQDPADEPAEHLLAWVRAERKSEPEVKAEKKPVRRKARAQSR